MTVLSTRRSAQLFAKLLGKVVRDRALKALSEMDLTETQFSCLRHVKLHGQVSVGTVAEALNISSPGATKLIERLVKKGMLQRQADPRDRRAVQVSVTESGRVAVESILAWEEDYFSSVIERMNPRDRESLERGLLAFVLTGLSDLPPEELCLKCGVEHTADCPLSRVTRSAKVSI